MNNHYFNNEEEDTFYENLSFKNEQMDKQETELINGNIYAMQNTIQNYITSDVLLFFYYETSLGLFYIF